MSLRWISRVYNDAYHRGWAAAHRAVASEAGADIRCARPAGEAEARWLGQLTDRALDMLHEPLPSTPSPFVGRLEAYLQRTPAKRFLMRGAASDRGRALAAAGHADGVRDGRSCASGYLAEIARYVLDMPAGGAVSGRPVERWLDEAARRWAGGGAQGADRTAGNSQAASPEAERDTEVEAV